MTIGGENTSGSLPAEDSKQVRDKPVIAVVTNKLLEVTGVS